MKDKNFGENTSRVVLAISAAVSLISQTLACPLSSSNG